VAYSEEVAQKICARIAEGEPLRAICREPGMPGKTQVYTWMDKDHADYNADFAGRFVRAREQGFDALAEETLEIADDDSRDWEPIKDQEGNITGVRVDGEHVQRSKVRIETRLKLLAKWDPKRYGEKVQLDGPGKNGAHIFEQIVRTIVDPKA
jgi:hypothetical protein